LLVTVVDSDEVALTESSKIETTNQSIDQSNIRLLTRRITRLTQTQAGFTEDLGGGKINKSKKILI